MAKHFISMLGTGLYEPVVYFDDIYNRKDKEWEFVQFAVIDKYKEQLLEDGRITIFVTEKSNTLNYRNRTYNERLKKHDFLVWDKGDDAIGTRNT